MADDKTKRGAADRGKVAGDQDYEIERFAVKHGLTTEEARALIARVGNNREKLDEAARELKRR
jgi:hypothetical protein